METYRPDRLLLITVVCLLAFGLLMIYSASAVVAAEKYGDSLYFFKRQFSWAMLGLIGMWTASRLNPGVWRRLALPLLGVSAVLLLMTLIPGIGAEINGARRWIRLGPVSFQPSELLKPAVLSYLALYLMKKKERMNDFLNGFLPPLILVGGMVLLVLAEPDLGTSAVIVLTTVVMLFLGGARIAHLVGTGLCLLVALVALVLTIGYRKQRIAAFLDPWGDPMGSGFQIIQSFLSFGHGGFLGVGLGEGRQKLFFLPEAHTDFIYAVIGEELGFMGSAAVLILFAILLWRCFRIVLSRQNSFEGNLAMGITVLTGIQAATNMGVVTGLLPTKGIPLPFLSFGGTSLVVTLVMMGIVLAISRTPASIYPVERERSGGCAS